jgi:hypothetical protein
MQGFLSSGTLGFYCTKNKHMHKIGCSYKISSKDVHMEAMEKGQDKIYELAETRHS